MALVQLATIVWHSLLFLTRFQHHLVTTLHPWLQVRRLEPQPQQYAPQRLITFFTIKLVVLSVRLALLVLITVIQLIQFPVQQGLTAQQIVNHQFLVHLVLIIQQVTLNLQHGALYVLLGTIVAQQDWLHHQVHAMQDTSVSQVLKQRIQRLKHTRHLQHLYGVNVSEVNGVRLVRHTLTYALLEPITITNFNR